MASRPLPVVSPPWFIPFLVVVAAAGCRTPPTRTPRRPRTAPRGVAARTPGTPAPAPRRPASARTRGSRSSHTWRTAPDRRGSAPTPPRARAPASTTVIAVVPPSVGSPVPTARALGRLPGRVRAGYPRISLGSTRPPPRASCSARLDVRSRCGWRASSLRALCRVAMPATRRHRRLPGVQRCRLAGHVGSAARCRLPGGHLPFGRRP